MKISITVCNVCKDKDRETLRYEIRSDGRRVVLDLCEEHRQPLEDLMPKGDSSGRTKTSGAVGASRRSPRSVVTLEEIEEQKRRERGGKN